MCLFGRPCRAAAGSRSRRRPRRAAGPAAASAAAPGIIIINDPHSDLDLEFIIPIASRLVQKLAHPWEPHRVQTWLPEIPDPLRKYQILLEIIRKYQILLEIIEPIP